MEERDSDNADIGLQRNVFKDMGRHFEKKNCSEKKTFNEINCSDESLMQIQCPQ